MQILIGAGATINTASDVGWTPLHETARYEHIELQKVRPRFYHTAALMETFEDSLQARCEYRSNHFRCRWMDSTSRGSFFWQVANGKGKPPVALIVG